MLGAESEQVLKGAVKRWAVFLFWHEHLQRSVLAEVIVTS
jgi:hypothetical protein